MKKDRLEIEGKKVGRGNEESSVKVRSQGLHVSGISGH